MALMTKETKTQLLNRVKSLAWRAGGLFVIGLLAWLIEPSTIEALKIPAYIVAIVGLISGEITKFINTRISEA